MFTIFTIFKHASAWTLNSKENNFQLEMRLRFFTIGLSSNFIQFKIGL